MSDGTSEDTTESVQIEEVKRSIRDLPFVTKLSPVRVQRPVEETGSRVGCQGLALGETRCVGLCAGSDAMVH